MKVKEQKLCSFSEKGYRLQLVQMNCFYTMNEYAKVRNWSCVKYQVRLNRKIVRTSISEYDMRELFATYCQNIVLQLKIY